MTAEKTAALARRINSAARDVCAVFAALNVVLVAAIVLQVALRRGFGGGFVVLEELQWHLYAVAVMLGVVYSQTTDSHVRVDALSRRFTRRTRRIVEICGTAFLFIPFCVVVFLHGLDFVYDSWRVNERSDSPVGLPARWLIKSVIPLTFGMLILVFLARILREIAALCGAEPETESESGRESKSKSETESESETAGDITPLTEFQIDKEARRRDD